MIVMYVVQNVEYIPARVQSRPWPQAFSLRWLNHLLAWHVPTNNTFRKVRTHIVLGHCSSIQKRIYKTRDLPLRI